MTVQDSCPTTVMPPATTVPPASTVPPTTTEMPSGMYGFHYSLSVM